MRRLVAAALAGLVAAAPRIGTAGGSLEPRAGLYLPVGASAVRDGIPAPAVGELYGPFLFGYGLSARWMQSPVPGHAGIWSLDYGAHRFVTESGRPRAYLTSDGTTRHKGVLDEIDFENFTNPVLSLSLLAFHLTTRFYWRPTETIAPYLGGGAQLLYVREEMTGQPVDDEAPPYALRREPHSSFTFGPQAHAGVTLFPGQRLTISLEARYAFHGEPESVYDPISFVARYKDNTFGGLTFVAGISLHLPSSTSSAVFGAEPRELVVDRFELEKDDSGFVFVVACLASDYAVYLESVSVAPAGMPGERQVQGISCRAGQRYTLRWRPGSTPSPGTYVGTVNYLYGIAEGFDSYGKPIWQSPPRTASLTATAVVR